METKTPKRHKGNLASELMPTNADALRILHERAARFAKIEEKPEALESISYIRFKLFHEFYGMPYPFIKEVLHKITITQVPLMPSFIAGIINWNGKLLTIIALKKFFNIQGEELHAEKTKSIIVVAAKEMNVGILVDDITNNSTYSPSLLDPPLPQTKDIKSEYIIGLHEGNTAIINIETVLADIKLQLEKSGHAHNHGVRK